jgi:hypothetical protein
MRDECQSQKLKAKREARSEVEGVNGWKTDPGTARQGKCKRMHGCRGWWTVDGSRWIVADEQVSLDEEWIKCEG